MKRKPPKGKSLAEVNPALEGKVKGSLFYLRDSDLILQVDE